LLLIILSTSYRSCQDNKRLRLDTDEGGVTDHANPSLAVQLDKTRKLLESSQLDEQKLR